MLGLRDVMDDPTRLAEEWDRKKSVPALENLYDHIWIYGIPEICDPLEGIAVSDSVRQKTRFTGYLRRGKTPSGLYPPPHEIEEPFYLVTTGGGGDGAMLVDWVLRAYEFDPTLDMPAKIVLGPFMGTSQQTGFMERVARHQASRGDRVRGEHGGADAARARASSRWAATTRSAKSCRSTSAR